MLWHTLFMSFFSIALMKSKVLQPPSIAISTKASRVPEVGGGPITLISRFGRLESISLHFWYGLATSLSPPLGSGTSLARARNTCLRLRSNFSASLELAITIPSAPIFTSVISFTPLLWHISNSLFFMRRDALVMSGCWVPIPAQNSFRPPPEPVDSSLGVGKSVLRPKRSATTVANGYTVEEPTMLTVSRAMAGVDTAAMLPARATEAIAVFNFITLCLQYRWTLCWYLLYR